MSWSFGPVIPNTGTLAYSDLQNVNTFHYKRSRKITFVNVTTYLLRKVLKREAVKVRVIGMFSKIQIPS